MNKYELMYGLGTPKPSVIPTTDPVYETKSPAQMLNDLSKALADGWRRAQPGPIHMTIAIPTTKTMRVVRHYKGRRYVVRISLFDILSGFFK